MQGYISRAELQIHDWSNLKVSIKIETLSLTVQFAAPRPSQRFGMEDTDASSGFSSLIPIQVLLKWLMMNLTVSAEHISVHLKTESVHTLQCDCRQASYKQVQSEATSEPGFQFQTSSIEFAVMNSASQSSTIARFLNVEELNAVLGTSEDDRMHIDLRAKVIRSILDPETLSLLKKLASTIKKRKKAYQEDFDVVMEDAESVAESVFYDVETSSKASSFHSAFSNSTFFDCDESDNFSPREPMKPIEFVLAVDLSETILRSNSNSENRFQLFLNGLACKGIWGEVSDIEVAVNWMRLVDISQEASSMQYCDSQAQIPDRLRLLMASREVNSTSYVQFGFRAMRNCDGLNAMIHLESQKNKIEMRSAAFVFEIGCASIRRLSVVMKSIKSAFSSKHISNDGSSDDHIEFIWTTNLICGSLKRPNLERQSSSFFFIEMIPDPGSPLIVSKDLRDHRWGYSAAIMETTSLSIVSLHMFHCVCEDDRIVDCRHILAFKAPPRSPLSNGNALTIDFTRVIQQLSSRYDLSKMAYDLIAMYSDRDIESFQDRTLYRVGYEEKCMNTADNILQIGLGIVEFHICLDDLEVFMDILLEFWRPSKMEDQMKTKPDRQTICILNGFQIAGRLHPSENVSSIPLECQLNEIEILMVMSLQRRSISTSAVTLGDFEIKAPENDMLFKMGGEGNESPCLQFFQVSELDFRNARFKQWTALHQRKLSIQINPSISALRPTLQWMQNWMGRHRDCLQTDIEVEYFTFLNDEHLSVAYSASPETSLNFCIERVSSISENTIKLLIDVKNLEAFLLTESSNPYKFTTEPQWSCQFKRDKDRNIEIEIRNQHLSINLNPNALKGLCQLGQSLIDVFPSSNEEERSESMDEMQSFMSNISTDAFASKNEASQSNQASMSYSPYQRMEEDEDGFVVVEDLLKEKDSTCLRNSSTTWLNGSALDIHDEYIVLPQIENEGSTSLLPDLQTTNNPSSGFALKFMDLSVACFLEAENSEHLDIIAKDVQIAFISFVPGSLYRNRLSVSIQEFEVLDGFSGEEGRKIVERTKSQLRTGCSRQMENNTTGFPMIQISIETVLPDVHLAKTTEKRFDLRIVPLRLRLSQELNAFCKPFKNAISIPTLSSSSKIALLCLAYFVVQAKKNVSFKCVRFRSFTSWSIIDPWASISNDSNRVERENW